MNNTRECNIHPLSADAAFGPIVQGCRHDFTFTFEQYFFSVVPSVLFLIFAPIRVNILRKREAKVGGHVLRYLKLAAISVYALLQLTTVILWATTGGGYGIRTPATVAWTLSLISSLALFTLSYLEHSRSLRPSALLNIYLFFSVLFDAVILRTLWTNLLFSAIRDLFTASFALKAAIMFLEAKEKRSYIRGRNTPGPEETSGLYSQSVLWWLNSIIRNGYQKVLSPLDLYPMDENMGAERLNERFWIEWNKASQARKPSLHKAVMKLLGWQLITPVLPRLALLGFTFCQPLMVSRLLDFLQNRGEDVSTGYGLIGAYAIVYFGMSVSNSLFLHQSYRFLSMLRGMLVCAIYTKTTQISITALDNSAAVTLMSTDVERLILGLRGFHDLWANLLQIALGTWLLAERVGWAAAGPAVVVFSSAAVTFGLATLTNKYQLGWVAKIQKRVGITSNMLGHMKGIKMSGLTTKMTDLIQDLRIDEIKYAKKFRSLSSIVSTLAFTPQTMSPLATFAFYAIIPARDGSTLEAPKLFTALALLILVTQPLFALLEDLNTFKGTLGCANRIEMFLVTETRSDHRIILSKANSRLGSLAEQSVGTSRWQAGPDDVELVTHAQSQTNQPDSRITSDVVRVEAGAFGWKKDEHPVLRDINLSIRRSELTLLIGPVASGKTTLLKAILGETPNSEGFVYVSDLKTSYCDQTPWLINASVKANIIGCSKFDQTLYDSVIYSCDLDQDIATFVRGHDTLIGSKGITLSTGQKQRVAVARAVYTKNDFIIFDDVFSGLDTNTQKNVFNRLLGSNGLLRKWKTTALVATHAVNLLSASDRIIALSANGTIAEQGTYQQLIATSGYVNKFCQEHANDHLESQGDNTKAGNLSSPDLRSQPQADANASSKEDKQRQLGDWSVYKYYFGIVGWVNTVIFLCLAAGWAFFSTFPTVWLKWYSDANAREPNKRTGYYLGVYAVFQVVMLLNTCASTWFSFNVMAKRSGLRLHEIILKTVMSAPMSFFSKTDTGSIITRFSQDMSLLDMSLPIAIMVVSGAFMTCFAQLGLIVSSAYYVGATFPALLAAYYAVQKYYLRTSRQMRFLDLEEKAPVYTQFIESLAGLTTIRAFNWQSPSIAHNHVLVDKSQKPFYLMFMIQTWLALVLDLMTTALAILVVGVSVKMRDTISVGFTGVSLTQIIGFTNNLRLAILFWTQMETSIGAVARVRKFENETENENQAEERNEPPSNWPSKGHIEIEELTVSYGSKGSRNALQDVSLSIKPGQKLAIVGRTGSGKSTLLLALFRMIDVSSGRIVIDNLDISTMPRHHIRSRFNAIGEDLFFISGSIRQNLDPYSASTDSAMQSALEKIGLWDVIVAKGGLNADFTDDMLSHGQRQIFCLARALLRQGTIVVMDEVTSAVDRETDALMQRVIREEFREKTVVTIAHRVRTVLDYDIVAVLDEGRIAEVGKPGELMQVGGGLFKGLVERSM